MYLPRPLNVNTFEDGFFVLEWTIIGNGILMENRKGENKNAIV